MTAVSRPVKICDVGPRDGLQNESRVLEPAVRAELCDRLAAAGVRRIEAVSFVNPKRVPPMAGAEEVLERLTRHPGVRYSGLALNERGYERAVAAGVDEVHYAFPVTDAFAQRNQNTTARAGADLAVRLIQRARADGIRITICFSVAFGCPYEGEVKPERVLGFAREIQAAGPDELVLADSIGVAVPAQVRELVAATAQLGATVAGHFHNTRNTGFANALAAVEAGCDVLDSSVGGTGGCPFAPRATGNIATEDLVYLLHGMGYETDIDLEALVGCSAWLAQQLGKELPGLVAKAGGFPPVAA